MPDNSHNSNSLKVLPVSQLKGIFRIPSFQRGYRWEPLQVIQLLNDLKNHDERNDNPYYLQPIVVAPKINRNVNDIIPDFDFDLIDGQQRLTTLFLVIKALEKVKNLNPTDLASELLSMGQYDNRILLKKIGLLQSLASANIYLNYQLTYQTRPATRDFLNDIANIDKSDARIVATPDHLYIWHAYQTVEKWIYDDANSETIVKIAKLLSSYVKIIWYELPEAVDSWKKFTDLNAGKIPLTNSELVKALFLSSSHQKIKEYEQDVVVSQWDKIERDLSNREFWSFLTKKSMSDYPTKIDLIFDIIAEKTDKNKKDIYFTFNYFLQLFDSESDLSGKQKWDDIYSKYQRIHDWFSSTWSYHRIGYLVTVGDDTTLINLFDKAYPKGQKPLSLSEFNKVVDEEIRKSIKLPDDIDNVSGLRYDRHPTLIQKVLTLYNVLLCDKLSEFGVRYPFFRHNDTDNNGWSLEHIHAQNSDELKGARKWKQWVADHLVSLINLTRNPLDNLLDFSTEKAESLIMRMKDFEKNPSEDEFKAIVNELTVLTAVNDFSNSEDDKHYISNLALLSCDDNSRLNKSTFDVKRRLIAEKISSNYVPIGTERVFMKSIVGHYTDNNGQEVGYECDNNQMFYWSSNDGIAYIHDIESTLGNYLSKKSSNISPIIEEINGTDI